MKNNTTTSIEMDGNRFKKLSKKLQKKINEKSSTDIKLNVIQESLSEALGFRNLNDFKNNDTVAQPSSSKNIFDDLMFSDNIEDSLYVSRYIFILHPKIKSDEREDLLALKLFNIFSFCSHNKNIPSFSLEEMKDPYILKTIASYDSRDFPIKDKIIEYINTSNDDDYHSDESFAYLMGKNSKVLEFYTQFITRYDRYYDAMLSFIEILKDFKDNYNMAIYKKSWFETDGYIKPQPNRFIQKSEFYYKSWLHMTDYLNIISYLDYLQPKDILTITGLILHAKRSISPELKSHISKFLQVILANYKQCAEVSKELVKLPF